MFLSTRSPIILGFTHPINNPAVQSSDDAWMQPIRTNNQASTLDDKGPTRDVKSPKMGRSSSAAHYQNPSDAFCITLGMAHKSDGVF